GRTLEPGTLATTRAHASRAAIDRARRTNATNRNIAASRFLPESRYTRRVRARYLGSSAVVAAFSACGHATHPPLAGDPAHDAGSTTEFQFDAGGVPDCELVQPDGSICGCTDVPVVSGAPTLYFVLDRSGSMNDENKWQTVRGAVSEVITAIGP